jgi:hypothetical protein
MNGWGLERDVDHEFEDMNVWMDKLDANHNEALGELYIIT